MLPPIIELIHLVVLVNLIILIMVVIVKNATTNVVNVKDNMILVKLLVLML